MPATLTGPEMAYLRKQCGLPPARPVVIEFDPDDPANRLLTTGEAAAVAHVPEATIRDWARTTRPLLEAADRDADGHPLYRELDVLTVEARTRRTARAQRLAAEALEGIDAPVT